MTSAQVSPRARRSRAIHVGLLTGVLAASFLARAAAAEPAHAALSYERGPEACPTEDAFRRQVMARLGYDPFAGGDASTSVGVKFTSNTGGLAADLSVTRDGRTTHKDRSGKGETCDALAESVATTLAMALDPIAASGAHPLPPLPAEAKQPDDTHVEVAPKPSTDSPPPSPAPTPRAPWNAFVLATVGGGIGQVPGAAIDASVGFDARLGRWGAVVDARYATTLSSQSTNSGDRVDASVIAAGPGACAHGAFLSGCAHARFGSFSARAENVVSPTDVRTFYAELAASGRARLVMANVGEVYALAELLVPLRPGTLRVGPDEAWSAPPISARLGVGGAFQLF